MNWQSSVSWARSITVRTVADYANMSSTFYATSSSFELLDQRERAYLPAAAVMRNPFTSFFGQRKLLLVPLFLLLLGDFGLDLLHRWRSSLARWTRTLGRPRAKNPTAGWRVSRDQNHQNHPTSDAATNTSDRCGGDCPFPAESCLARREKCSALQLSSSEAL